MRTKDLHSEDRYVRRETEVEGVGNKSPGVLLSCFMTLLALVVILLPACILNRRRSRRRRIQDSEALARTMDTGVESERRYYSIEAWLINKQVLAHDEVCDLAIQLSTSPTENKSATSITDSSPYLDTCDSEAEDESLDEDDAKHECPICFERFLVGEIVSWSPNPRCDHVFHHHCIKEWLQNRKDCPFCREMFLPVDKVSGEITISDIPELILGQKRRNVPCFYCLKHQVIHVPKATQLDQLTDDVSDPVRHVLLERSTTIPERAVLTSLRGRCPRSNNPLSTDTTMLCSGDGYNPQLSETCQSEGNLDPVLMNIEHSTSVGFLRNDDLVFATDIALEAFDTASSTEIAAKNGKAEIIQVMNETSVTSAD